MEGKRVLFYVLFLSISECFFRVILGQNTRPNIVLIAVDQFGFDEFNDYLGYAKNIRTLSNEAIQCSHAYSQLYPISSRAALLTGRLPVRTGMVKGRFLPFTSLPSIASSGGLPLNEQTLAEFLRRKGYTNKFIGLWDQGFGRKGKFLPLNQGFDTWFGVLTRHSKSCTGLLQKPHETFVNEALSLFLYGLLWLLFVVVSLWCLCFLKAKLITFLVILGVIVYATNARTTFIIVRSCVLYKDTHMVAQPYDVENITLRFTDEALGFIKTGARPFFLMVNHLALSKPLFASPVFTNTSGKSDAFLDSLVELDWSVGSILKTIEHFNLTDDTVVIFTALSGGVDSNDRRLCKNSLDIQEGEDGCHNYPLKGRKAFIINFNVWPV
jgi:arylsulfatase A-like enzyme